MKEEKEKKEGRARKKRVENKYRAPSERKNLLPAAKERGSAEAAEQTADSLGRCLNMQSIYEVSFYYWCNR